MNRSWMSSSFWLWLSAVFLLGFGCAAGMIWPHHFEHLLSPGLNQMRQLALKTNALHSPLHTSLVVFLHNLFAAAVVMILTGIFTLGVYPAWGLWMNGLTMGYVAAVEGHQLGLAAWKLFVYGMLPHGIFELPAFIWSAVIGMKLGYAAVYSVWNWFRPGPSEGNGGKTQFGAFTSRRAAGRSAHELRANRQGGVESLGFWAEFSRSAKQLPYVVGLLMVAAAVEGTVTPHLIELGLHHAVG